MQEENSHLLKIERKYDGIRAQMAESDGEMEE